LACNHGKGLKSEMKIFDCITFFEENRHADLRFNILNDYVDYFVVCEGLFDHKGNKKKINFNLNNYPKFKKKIIHIICPKFPKKINPWERQAYQRDYILKNIEIAKDNDLILFSDPDEIPNPKKIKNLILKKKYLIFLQNLYYYKINLQDINLGNNWEGTRGCLKKNLYSINYMRQKVLKKNLKYKFWRIDKEKNIQIINDGGWHFSYLLTPSEIQRKIKTFAHTEYNKKKFTNLKIIKNKIKKGLDLFNRNIFFMKKKLDQTFPEYILKNKKNFYKWIV
jgi:beta-1,4-mannosyl-glycoprotein beta-1,4-N-acetylglucosaminyltransferase